MKQCTVFGTNKNDEDFKIKFDFGNEDYMERLCHELEKVNNVTLEDCERIYISDPNVKKFKKKNK